MCDYAFFSKDPSQWDEAYQSLWGCDDICPILEQFHVTQVIQPDLSSLTCLLAWDDPKRFHSDVAFLLIFPKEGIAKERVYGLAMVWQENSSCLPLPGLTGPMQLCSSMGMPIMCLSQKKVT